jgi:hypothetical protein
MLILEARNAFLLDHFSLLAQVVHMSTTEKNEVKPETTSQDRSPKYPRLMLEDAIGKAGKVHKEIGKSSVSIETVASILGYKNLAGGATQATLSAMFQYGLLLREPSKKVSVTPLTIRILHPADEAQRLRSTQEAALTPPLFLDILKNYHQMSDMALKSHLIQSDFTPDGAEKVVSIYKVNSLFAKLDSADFSDPSDSKISEKTNFSLDNAPQHLKDEFEERTAANEKHRGKKMLAQYSIPIGASEATITFIGEKLAVEDFDALADYVAIFKKQFERKVDAEKLAKAAAQFSKRESAEA